MLHSLLRRSFLFPPTLGDFNLWVFILIISPAREKKKHFIYNCAGLSVISSGDEAVKRWKMRFRDVICSNEKRIDRGSETTIFSDIPWDSSMAFNTKHITHQLFDLCILLLSLQYICSMTASGRWGMIWRKACVWQERAWAWAWADPTVGFNSIPTLCFSLRVSALSYTLLLLLIDHICYMLGKLAWNLLLSFNRRTSFWPCVGHFPFTSLNLRWLSSSAFFFLSVYYFAHGSGLKICDRQAFADFSSSAFGVSMLLQSSRTRAGDLCHAVAAWYQYTPVPAIYL